MTGTTGRRAPGRSGSGAAQDEVRRHNLSAVLTIVHRAGSITRSELTERLGLSRSTIKALVAELVALGVVTETRPAGARAGAGRPSLVVLPHEAAAHVLAADVGVDRILVGAYRLGGGFTASREAQLSGGPPTVAQVTSHLRVLVAAVLEHPGVSRVLGLGVALPAIVRSSDGFVRFAPNLRWVDEPFGAVLEQTFPGLRIVVANDSDLGALGEHLRGAGRDVDDLLYVHGDVGIGAGFVLAGRSVNGVAGYAGEVGHMVTRPDGPVCRCGVRGCWETEVGGPAVAAALGWPAGAVQELAQHLRSPLPRPERQALAEVARAVGRGVGTLVNILNPRTVILGGLLQCVYEAASEEVDAGMRAVALRACLEEVRLAGAACDPDAVLVGAAESLWLRLLEDPAASLAPPPATEQLATA
jgi:predicted NBD/HSP70 family sugar kinase